MSVRHVMAPFFVIFTLNVSILIIFTVAAPMTWIRQTEPESVNEFSSYGKCYINDNPVSIACIVAIAVLNFAAVVLALVQLYRAKNLSAEYR